MFDTPTHPPPAPGDPAPGEVTRPDRSVEPDLVDDLTDLDADAALAYAAEAQARVRRAEADLVAVAAHWGRLHDRLDHDSRLPGSERLVQLAGDGAPQVAEFAVAELACILGLSTGQARMLIGDALDLTHRLPAVWARVQTGQVPVWKARRVAERTRGLSLDQVGAIDADVAGYATSLPASRLDRLVRAAVIDTDPTTAGTTAERAKTEHGVWVSQPADDGNTDIFIRTDATTALRFDHLIGRIATSLSDGTATRDQRRAMALGHLTGHTHHPATGDATSAHSRSGSHDGGSSAGCGSCGCTGGDGEAQPVRPAVVYVHVNQTTLTGHTHTARVEGIGPVVADQARDWLSGCTVTVTPVIDLHQQVPVDAWETPLRIREHVRLRTPVDMFPYAGCDSRQMDLDHTIAYQPGGPPGQTRPDNLGPLTRHHHRIKTHSRWKLAQPYDGVYVWQTPHGHHYLVDHHGTHRAIAPAGETVTRNCDHRPVTSTVD